MTLAIGGFLTVPCSCGGANENCFKCDGWGYVDKIGNGLPTPIVHDFGVRFIVPKSKSPKHPLIQCPNCRLWVWKLQKHLTKVHGLESQHAAPITQKELVKCNRCNSWVRQDRLKAHTSRVHPNPSLPLVLGTPKPATAYNAVSSSRRSATTGKEIARQSNERQLDATSDYYDAYRDNGQFGSYPSHDAFDDESTP
jgi:hypothetical protein